MQANVSYVSHNFDFPQPDYNLEGRTDSEATSTRRYCDTRHQIPQCLTTSLSIS